MRVAIIAAAFFVALFALVSSLIEANIATSTHTLLTSNVITLERNETERSPRTIAPTTYAPSIAFPISISNNKKNNQGPMSWWMHELGLKSLPFHWTNAMEQDPETDERTPIEAMFPCESQCDNFKTSVFTQMASCRKRYNAEQEFLPVGCQPAWNQLKCAKNSAQCKRKRAFHLNSKRALYSLADVAVELARSKRKQKVEIFILGDSIGRQMFEVARCHLMRSVNLRTQDMVQVKQNANFASWPSEYITLARSTRYSVQFGRKHTFMIPVAETEVIVVSLVYQTAFRAIADDPEFHLQMCSQADLFISTWGAHYPDPFQGDFHADMTNVTQVWRECIAHKETTVIYAGHPMQHFFNGDPALGWFNKSMEDRTCAAIPKSTRAKLINGMDQFDGWTKVLRQLVELVPTPWQRESEMVFCPNTSSSRIGGVHWFPWIDLTEHFEHLHFDCSMTDCTHIQLLPQLYTPLWDALYLAVARDGRIRNQQCDYSSIPPPQFSSLAKHRVLQANLTLALQDNFEHMLQERPIFNDSELIPFTLERANTDFSRMSKAFRAAKLAEGKE